ncbi:hypothetical protein [Streptomyces sp. NPDC091212]|uniref:hypothetical protein n=1 Tax=Streptomyces sp. NPDC091212 TaxID=3155191 RepID=UPI0034204C7F
MIVNVPTPAGIATLVAYIATIPAANLAATHIGALPVGFGYEAPAGVYMVGLALASGFHLGSVRIMGGNAKVPSALGR